MFRIFRFYIFPLLFLNFCFPVLQLCCCPSNLGRLLLSSLWLGSACFHWIGALHVSGQHRRLFLTKASGMLILFLCGYDESCLHSRVCPAFRLAGGKELGVRLGCLGHG
ncbi:hypothetical protein F5144DRAFT_567047 [Chaetomium tenue]|uniref:Uncharacterized protein n=1 Tax=Chaetomium tenue TaxID=1854479 RepID=A0ACB7PBT9_9PEZI|nr:hypothetical protein F5144DRAFT_567047 [Chaetomium globosum]